MRRSMLPTHTIPPTINTKQLGGVYNSRMQQALHPHYYSSYVCAIVPSLFTLSHLCSWLFKSITLSYQILNKDRRSAVSVR